MPFDPGPVDRLELGDFGQVFEPPALTPIAAEFATSLAPLLEVLDVAYDVLAAEALLDLAPGFDADLNGLRSVAPSDASPAPLDDLIAAEQGWADVRQQLADLRANLPPEAFEYMDLRVNPSPT